MFLSVLIISKCTYNYKDNNTYIFPVDIFYLNAITLPPIVPKPDLNFLQNASMQ